MTKFRKKPVVIVAEQYTAERRAQGRLPEGVYIVPGESGDDEPVIHTLEGDLHVSDGDWIITGVKGERYPCKPDIFAATYEAAAVADPHDDDNGRAFFISRHEIDTRFKDAAKFLLDCYERFQSLVTPRSAGGDDLVLLWREDYEELMRRPAASSADSASGLLSDLNSEGSQR